MIGSGTGSGSVEALLYWSGRGHLTRSPLANQQGGFPLAGSPQASPWRDVGMTTTLIETDSSLLHIMGLTSEGARERGDEGARGRGSEGTRERGSEGTGEARECFRREELRHPEHLQGTVERVQASGQDVSWVLLGTLNWEEAHGSNQNSLERLIPLRLNASGPTRKSWKV
ncbi:unnamed protein product [Pleuronectes platessa]|uniref:Uncharacterized protein n=1 Tax=Pleuronectes platessa TaxID=8262 RepID=A0A9N7W0F5_PLEPL|nr:unnamed protein product [Pleuronectes platessa]